MTMLQQNKGEYDLPDYKLSDLKEVFNIFKSQGKNADGEEFITPEGMRNVMTSLGQNPTEQEIQGLFEKIDKNKSGTIGFDEFLQIFSEKIEDADVEEDLIDSIRNFEVGNTGVISEIEFIRVMTTYGDAMLEDEANLILDRMRKEGLVSPDGDINYLDVMKIMRKPKDFDEMKAREALDLAELEKMRQEHDGEEDEDLEAL
jgi:Ca2+-binding EF-hand superfamily protein